MRLLLELIDELDGEIEDVESLLERLRGGLVWAVDEINQLTDDLTGLEHELADYRHDEETAGQRLDYYLSAR